MSLSVKFLCCLDVCQEKNSIEDKLRAKFESEMKLKEELHQEMERLKIKHEKQINELNNELDRLRTNGEFQHSFGI